MAYKNILALVGLIAVVKGEGTLAGISWGAPRIDVLGVDSYGDIFHKYYTGYEWEPYDKKHGNLEIFDRAKADSDVSVASWGNNRLDFVFIDSEGSVKHKYWDGSGYGPSDDFETLGYGVSGKLAIDSWGEDRIDIVGLSGNGTYLHKAWTGSSWYPSGDGWEDLGGEDFVSAPSIVSSRAGSLDIFGITSKGAVHHKWWDGYQWQPEGQKWSDMGGKDFSGSLTSSSAYAGRWDVWAVSDDSGELHHAFWDGHNYHDWESLGGNFAEAPQVVHWSSSRTDILGKDAGKNSKYVYKYYDGYSWSEWYDKGEDFETQPALVSIAENNLNLIGVGKDGKLKLQVWDGSNFLPNSTGYFTLGDTKFSESSRGSKSPHDGVEKVMIELKFRA